MASQKQLPPPFINEIELTKSEKLFLMKSHYLAPRRLVKMAIQKYIDLHGIPPFQFQEEHVLVRSDEHTTHTVGREFYIDEVTLAAWKRIISFYDALKQKGIFDDFLEMLSDYPKYRVGQFLEEYADFSCHGANVAWCELRSQIEDCMTCDNTQTQHI